VLICCRTNCRCSFSTDQTRHRSTVCSWTLLTSWACQVQHTYTWMTSSTLISLSISAHRCVC